MHLLAAVKYNHIRHILPTSDIDILVCYLFSIDISEQHVRELNIVLLGDPSSWNPNE